MYGMLGGIIIRYCGKWHGKQVWERMKRSEPMLWLRDEESTQPAVCALGLNAII